MASRKGYLTPFPPTLPPPVTEQQLGQFMAGNYIFGVAIESAANQSPASMAAFSQANVPFQTNVVMPDGTLQVIKVAVPQIVPLPGWWFSGQ